MVASLSEDDPLHSGVEFSDPDAGIPEQLLAVSYRGRQRVRG